jgi:hypothetical protein
MLGTRKGWDKATNYWAGKQALQEWRWLHSLEFIWNNGIFKILPQGLIYI